MAVVLNAKFAQLLAEHANKKRRWETKKLDKSAVFLLVKHADVLTFILTVHAKTSSLYTFQRSMQATKNMNLW